MIVKLLALPLMTYVSVTDAKTQTIPNAAALGIAMLGLLGLFAEHAAPIHALARLVPALALLFAALRTGGVGGGDIKLCAALGLFQPPLYTCAALAAATGAVYVSGKLTKRKSVPVAPYLCGAVLAAWLLGR